MGDEGEFWRDVKVHRRAERERLGVSCPRCKEVRPRAHPTILMPGQKCRVDGYVDPRTQEGVTA